jgi:hypothetical protein
VVELGAVSADNLARFNRTIAQWTRLSGSEDERRAAEYVRGELAGFGYDARVILHDAYISLPGEASLRVIRPREQEIFCITHSMGIPTPPGGVTAELVYAGRGTPAEYARAGAAGKVALVEGRATPQHAVNATAAGALGIVCISGRHAHEMCCSPVWGNPSATTAASLPKVHLLSVHQADGETLRALCQAGRVEVRFTASVQTGWTRTPIVVGDLAAGHPEAETGKYVLFSGHLDSWYLGAMDNGSANATMLEVARLMAGRRGAMRRALRCAFWSGHSHGRYSSSAWYADSNWFDLRANCVVHVNIDSVGAVDADDFATNSMPETARLAVDAVREVAGAALDAHRVGRNSDQSFWGLGIPSLLGSVSRQKDGSLGWWWHTPHDTLDKIDPDRLLRDARIFARVVGRLCEEAVLPLDYAASAADLRRGVEAAARQAGAAVDLSDTVAAAVRLEGLCRELQAMADRVAAAGDPAAARAVNACYQALGRALIPVGYTAAGPFAHDPALETGFLPLLGPAQRLEGCDPGSDEAKFLAVDLVRGRNAVRAALREATAAVEATLARLG